MGWWACKYCTLHNDASSALCAACGSQNPATLASNQSSFLPKLPKVSVTGALNAIDSALTSVGLIPSAPSHSPPSRSPTKWYRSIVDRLLPPCPNSDSERTSLRLYSSSSIHLEKQDVQDASNTFMRITQFCKSNKIPFIDDSFPQCVKSIGDLSQNEGTLRRRIDAKDLIWLRPQDMFTKDGRRYAWTVFRDPKSSDIEQGL
ncbi:unnamed protein product [Toxocara canis]|uniref:RanBP2-type domain-containing protein n=1 Tax=Toxocara canis TaxID=6265 RepID=A0A183U4E3_TOXCA|nr:unnamed protein product [Toxocara canis]